MEILQLKYFLYTAHTENISHTAHKFMVPPSSVSAAIKKLENELGMKLFERTANTLRLNEYGKIFMHGLEKADSELKKAKMDMLDLSSQPSGEINLLIMTNRRIITGIISEFRNKYPTVSFNIKHSDQSDVNRSKYDIIISDGVIKSDFFTGNIFIHDEIFLAAHRDEPVSKLMAVNIKSLSGGKFICMPKSTAIGNYFDKLCRENGLNAEIVIECDDPYYIREYVKMGLGMTLYPRISWGEPTDKRVCLVRINDGLYRDSYIYLNRNSGNTARLLAEMIRYRAGRL